MKPTKSIAIVVVAVIGAAVAAQFTAGQSHAEGVDRRVVQTAASPATPVVAPATERGIVESERAVAARLAADPIAREVPRLLDRPPELQLQTLRWMRDTSGSKLVSAFPAVQALDRPMAERLEQARRRADELIAVLERRVQAG